MDTEEAFQLIEERGLADRENPYSLQRQMRRRELHMKELEQIGKKAQAAEPRLRKLSADEKNTLLLQAAEDLILAADAILEANAIDMDNARAASMPQGKQDRLQLTKGRIEAMADGLRTVAGLDDPIGQGLGTVKRPNGLLIEQKRVPLGVIGVIYEARPNVTADVFALTFKTGNAVILKGGSDAINSNRAITAVLRSSLAARGLPEDAIQLIESVDRAATQAFMQMDEYVDVLIPRGSHGLIQAVKKNSSIPVIETGTGNCHIYVDESADPAMAVNIIVNAKTQRIGVCNACESLVIHEKILPTVMPMIAEALAPWKVEIRADEKALPYVTQNGVPASEEDFGTEYLDYILSVKTVSNIDEAVTHINTYNTGHSEAIVTRDYASALKFQDEIDASSVYVNASTRFTDGGEFGFGAEVGISTQKLHARGPMGLLALTTTKFCIFGNGQIRPDGAASTKAK
ncbi:MAG: glutamate-5-semialdehyde dehydrogenase [Eubacteriales bacterium]|nr:glutamate-5-semialdehyde dehydrogenase [Eubacteriales bacterium]